MPRPKLGIGVVPMVVGIAGHRPDDKIARLPVVAWPHVGVQDRQQVALDLKIDPTKGWIETAADVFDRLTQDLHA